MLDKIYKDQDIFGSIDDIFNFKITIFYDKQRQMKLLTNAYIYNTAIMLFSQA